MKIGISGDDGFISTYLINALGDDAVVISDEVFKDGKMLDAALAGCECLVHLNGHSPINGMDRNDGEAIPIMREKALKIAEGQLWTEERCMEHAKDTHPVSVLRVSNLHGIPPEGGKGRGFLHEFARQAMTGWIAVQGSGNEIKDLVHVNDLIGVILRVAHNPPPTREAHAIGIGCEATLAQLAQPIADQNGADIQLYAKEADEIWGAVDARELSERLEWRPQISLEAILSEAVSHAMECPY